MYTIIPHSSEKYYTMLYASSFIWLILCKQKLGFNINWRHFKLIHWIPKIICILSAAANNGGGDGDGGVDGIAFQPHPIHTFTLSEPSIQYIRCLPFSSSKFRRRQYRQQRWFCTLRAGDRKQRKMFVVFVNLKPLANIWLCVHIIYWNIGIVLMKDLTFSKFMCIFCLPTCMPILYGTHRKPMWTI